MGNSWSWGQNKTTLPSALSVVCDDNPPDKQAWNNSDSTSSSQSSSRQELNSIMDNEGPSVVWSSSNFDDNNLTPTPNSSSLSHPDPSNHGTTQWNSARGAFSAPSSPSMPRSQSQPDSSSKSPARPSVDDSGVRSWNKHKSPRSQSSSDTPSGWNHNTQEARRSSVDMSFPGEISKSPWQYSSRQQELYQSNYSREPWADSHVSPSSVDVANVLKRLTLEKYLSVFQVRLVWFLFTSCGFFLFLCSLIIKEKSHNFGIPCICVLAGGFPTPHIYCALTMNMEGRNILFFSYECRCIV